MSSMSKTTGIRAAIIDLARNPNPFSVEYEKLREADLVEAILDHHDPLLRIMDGVPEDLVYLMRLVLQDTDDEHGDGTPASRVMSVITLLKAVFDFLDDAYSSQKLEMDEMLDVIVDRYIQQTQREGEEYESDSGLSPSDPSEEL